MNPRFCTRCKTPLVECRRKCGFYAETGKPQVMLVRKCPRGHLPAWQSYQAQPDVWNLIKDPQRLAALAVGPPRPIPQDPSHAG